MYQLASEAYLALMWLHWTDIKNAAFSIEDHRINWNLKWYSNLILWFETAFSLSGKQYLFYALVVSSVVVLISM